MSDLALPIKPSQAEQAESTRPAQPTLVRGRIARQWIESPLARYSFPFFAVGAAVLLRMGIGTLPFYDVSFLLPFIAIAASAMFGGWAPGLVATALAATAEGMLFSDGRVLVPPHPGLKLLIEGGALMSFVGGQVHAARWRARISDAATIDLERKMLEIGDEERRGIGHDLHDGLGQHLTGIALLSESLTHRIRNGAIPLAADAEKVTQLVSQAVGWTRDLARGLSPVTLESDGLVAAMEELSEKANSLFGVECHWDYTGTEPALDRQRALHMYRIVQEAVSNSVKHGKAKSVQIRLDVLPGEVTASVIDDGCGLSAKTKANPGLGLRIMTYRARVMGADLSVERLNADGGTKVVCRCPVQSGN